MKKFILLFVISMMSFVLLSQEITWTVVDCKEPGDYFKEKVGYLFADRFMENKICRIKPGSKAYPIVNDERTYRVRLEDGQIGWVVYLNLKEISDIAEKIIKKYDPNIGNVFYDKENIDDLILNKSDSNLIHNLGIPAALANIDDQSIWYYPHIKTFHLHQVKDQKWLAKNISRKINRKQTATGRKRGNTGIYSRFEM